MDWDVPDASWPCWVKYDNDLERRKRTTTSTWGWSQAIVARLNSLDTLRMCAREFGVQGLPDPTMHGGGLQVTAPSGYLACHLDLDKHPNPFGAELLRDKKRVVNMVVFCHAEWRKEWGGEFYLANPMGVPVVKIDPVPGRLLAFETVETAYHGVLPVTGPNERVTVTVSLIADADKDSTRCRALFMPTRGK